MALLTILNNWRLILMAGVATAFAVLIALFKHRGKKIKGLENEVQTFKKKDEIKKRQDEQVAQIVADEQQEILAKVKGNAKKDNSTRIDSL